jgi:hypothetical protein
LLIGLAIGLSAYLLAWWSQRVRSSAPRRLLGVHHALFGAVFGVPGLLGFLMWTLTEHAVTYRNENQLLANPLTFLLLPLGIGMLFDSQRALRASRVLFYILAASSLLLLVLKLLPNFDQDTILPMTLLLPANLGGALAHRALAHPAPQALASPDSQRSLVSRA